MPQSTLSIIFTYVFIVIIWCFLAVPATSPLLLCWLLDILGLKSWYCTTVFTTRYCIVNYLESLLVEDALSNNVYHLELTYVTGHETTVYTFTKIATWRFIRRVLNCSSLTLRYIASVIHLTSSHGHLVISHDQKEEGSTEQWGDLRERGEDCIHISSIIIYVIIALFYY